eukprot:jgi/Chlat1/2301/Chrsp17S08731
MLPRNSSERSDRDAPSRPRRPIPTGEGPMDEAKLARPWRYYMDNPVWLDSETRGGITLRRRVGQPRIRNYPVLQGRLAQLHRGNHAEDRRQALVSLCGCCRWRRR